MIRPDHESPEEHPAYAVYQFNDPDASFEVKVGMCKTTVATELPYYQKDKEMVNS